VTLPGIFAGESATMIRFLVPWEGIDVRHVYLFANPHSIVFEVLRRYILKHCSPVDT
jgi:hypothetical protein